VALVDYSFEANEANLPQKNLELLVKRILSIDSKTNPYNSRSSQVDLFLSSIQTAMTRILVNTDNQFILYVKLFTELYEGLTLDEKEHSRDFCEEITRELHDFLVVCGVDEISKEVAIKQQVMNRTYMRLRRSGGHISQDYSFLNDFIEKYGPKYLEVAKLWVFLDGLFAENVQNNDLKKISE
jgi:hypothetical protein